MTTQPIPKVFIIILNWNGLRDTLECLESVERLEYPAKTVVVVDNGSTDGSPEAVRTQAPSVLLLRNETNLGYAGGNNVGIRYALEHGADYIWLLNNDTVVRPDSLATLVSVADATPNLGLASPFIYDYEGPQRLQFGGVIARLADQTFHRVNDPLEREGPTTGGRLVLYGTALLIKASAVKTIGYLDERYFAYREDNDYSMRSLDAGLRNIVVSASKVYHKNSGSLGENSPIKYFFMVRNLYPLWMDRLKGYRRAAYRVRYLSQALRTARECETAGFPAAADACLAGAWNALRGRYGEYDPGATFPRALKRLLYWHPYFWIRVLDWRWGQVALEAIKRFVSRSPRR
ncbi:MAG: glycosyltransferase family 2 protein [Candidatus Rokubacteria bacterium]|nr:glycosyltransferase family 2 protein [Candidatus Rokubacteria bacterium]